VPFGEQQRRVQQRLKLLLDRRGPSTGCDVSSFNLPDQAKKRKRQQNPTRATHRFPLVEIVQYDQPPIRPRADNRVSIYHQVRLDANIPLINMPSRLTAGDACIAVAVEV
jgi:hypothetical protein